MKQISAKDFETMISGEDVVHKTSYDIGGYTEVYYMKEGSTLTYIAQKEVFDDVSYWIDEEV